MSWRERAVKGSWRDRAVVEDQGEKEAEFWQKVDSDYEARKPSTVNAFGTGAIQGITRDWGDEILGGAKTLFDGGTYDENVLRVRQNMQRAKNENPNTYATGDFIGAVGSAPLMTNPAGAAAVGFSEGALKTLGSASKINENSLLESANRGTQDAMLAGMLTKYGPKVFDALGSATKPIVDPIKDFAGRHAIRAMGRATPTQVKNMEKKKITAEVGKWALDNKVVTPFASNKKMAERTEQVLDDVAEQMRPLYKAARDQKVTSDQLKDIVKERAQQAAQVEGGVPLSEQLMKFHDEVEKAAQAGRTEYTPEGLKRFRQAVQRRTNWNTEPVGQEGHRKFRNVLRKEEMGAIRRNDPEAAALNEKLFRSVHLGSRAQEVAERGAQQTQTNNRFGLTSYLLGGGALGADLEPAIKAGLSGGTMIGRELFRRYGDQWLATGANKIGNVMSNETYRPLFEAAMKRGGTAVADLHNQLMNSDPAYAGYVTEGKQTAESTPESKAMATGLSATNNLTFGLDDEISGIASALTGGDYTQSRDRYRRAKEEAGATDPVAFHGTDIAMNMLTPALGKASKGASELERILRGAGAGALVGGLSGAGRAKELSDVPRETFQSALMGGGMGAAGASLNSSPKSQVYESGMARPQYGHTPLRMPATNPTLHREVKIDGQDLQHFVFQNGPEVGHYLVDDKGRVAARIMGTLSQTRHGPGIKIDLSNTDQKGFGKKLYDLVLDTHQNLTSDTALSQKGSNRVYTEHFTAQPGVKTDLSSWGSRDPHRVTVTDPVAFHDKKKFPPFGPEYSENRRLMEEMITKKKAEGYRRDLPERAEPVVPDRSHPVYDWVIARRQSGASPAEIRKLLTTNGYSRESADGILASDRNWRKPMQRSEDDSYERQYREAVERGNRLLAGEDDKIKVSIPKKDKDEAWRVFSNDPGNAGVINWAYQKLEEGVDRETVIKNLMAMDVPKAMAQRLVDYGF